jgi:hypothetical protein
MSGRSRRKIGRLPVPGSAAADLVPRRRPPGLPGCSPGKAEPAQLAVQMTAPVTTSTAPAAPARRTRRALPVLTPPDELGGAGRELECSRGQAEESGCTSTRHVRNPRSGRAGQPRAGLRAGSASHARRPGAARSIPSDAVSLQVGLRPVDISVCAHPQALWTVAPAVVPCAVPQARLGWARPTMGRAWSPRKLGAWRL